MPCPRPRNPIGPAASSYTQAARTASRLHRRPAVYTSGRLHAACLARLHTSLSTPGSGGVRRRAALRPFAPSVASRSLTFRPQERTRRRATASSLLSSGLQRGPAVTDTLAPATSARPARLSPAACRTSWDRYASEPRGPKPAPAVTSRLPSSAARRVAGHTCPPTSHGALLTVGHGKALDARSDCSRDADFTCFARRFSPALWLSAASSQSAGEPVVAGFLEECVTQLVAESVAPLASTPPPRPSSCAFRWAGPLRAARPPLVCHLWGGPTHCRAFFSTHAAASTRAGCPMVASALVLH